MEEGVSKCVAGNRVGVCITSMSLSNITVGCNVINTSMEPAGNSS